MIEQLIIQHVINNHTQRRSQLISARAQTHRNFKVTEVFSRHSNVLQTWHEFTVEAAHRVAGEEARITMAKMIVDLAQVRQQ